MRSQENVSASTDLVVCRCEWVTWGVVQQALESFQPTSLRELKLVTRWGMGMCQGRVCRPLMACVHLPDGDTGGPPGLSPRIPYKPVAMSALFSEGGQEDA
ncbi:(2Fe-2S)-binding protein [Sulfobacillus harzensis]|uniref:BFD-like [2Fe-2S]-binding domain-containing protein n=1 Tax=Sulfobacillus harzensis TaxID=2729629 RepID=A0A7Y0Q1G1_9FIRM|nr:(2Fe-2S)-binding protein [Sulfobacillus harzensis]NMP21422.1 hypothetical protein [Sulfobacillus harzensis]